MNNLYAVGFVLSLLDKISTKKPKYKQCNHFYRLYELRVSQGFQLPQWVHDTAELGHANCVNFNDALNYLMNINKDN